MHANRHIGQNGPLQALPEGGYIPANPLSELCFRKVSSWIRDCIYTHSSADCQAKRLGTSNFVPVRLIAVGSWAASPKIVELQCAAVDYTALSYCWGTTNIAKTTKANLLERKSSMPWACLPKVFQDAIALTRALGLKYIWIDALCIVQDDAADLDRQLSQMAQVYHEAYLVISADSANSADGRLFKERQRSLRIRTISPKEPTEVSEVLLRDLIDHEPFGGRTIPGHNWPLATRGWTLQERFLATRIIHFSAAELVWECNERLRCECKYMDHRAQKNDMYWTSLRSRYIHILHDDTADSERAVCWCEIVREYSGRKLSKDSDRLAAISGLASQFGNLAGWEYKAGIWTNHVLRMISWNRSPINTSRRPQEYVAPSWSWASVIGPIDWEFDKDWDFADMVPKKDDNFVAQVLDIECRLSGKDPFGRVCSGHLTIASPTLTVGLRRSKKGGKELDLRMRHTLILDIDSPREITDLPDTVSIKCLFLEELRSADAPAIVVKSCSSDFQVFTRIGRLFVHQIRKLPALTTEVLTIC